MDTTTYLKDKLQHRLHDSEVLQMLASGNSLNAYKAGYWAGSEDTDEMLRCRVSSEIDKHVSIDDNPGPVCARRNPAGVWVSEPAQAGRAVDLHLCDASTSELTDADYIKLIGERDSLKADCQAYKRTVVWLDLQVRQWEERYNNLVAECKHATDAMQSIIDNADHRVL